MSKALYRSPQIITSYDVPMLMGAATGVASTISCFEEPTPTSDFMQS